MDFLGSILAVLRPLCCITSLILLASLTATILLHPFPARAGQQSDHWPRCDNQGTLQQVSFVHLSDMHGNYNPGKNGSSPVSRARGYYEMVKKENPFTVFTNSGDDYEKGSIAEVLSQGRSTREVVHAMGYDVRTLGNHDFAWGITELLQFSNDPKAVVLSTNSRINRQIDSPLRNTPTGFTDFTVLTVGCVRIGFFGLTARPYGHDGLQHNGPVYPEVPALEMDFDFLAIAKRVIAEHRSEVDVLVLLSHMGLTDDIIVAEQTSGIDLILGGHSHSTLEKPQRVKDTVIVHVGSHVEHIGRYDLSYDLTEKRIVDNHFQLVANIAGELPDDLPTAETVAKILQSYQEELHETVAEVKQDQSQPAMASIAARAAVQKLRVDAAFVDTSSVWQPWHEGFLTQQDILDAFKVEREPVGTPGASSLYLLDISGADLLHARTILKNAAYWGPKHIDPRNFYTVAMQKPQVYSQQKIFSRILSLAPPRPAAELWEVVTAFAGDLNAYNLALDEGSDNMRNNEMVVLFTGEKTAHPTL